jgi:hypothetical protein
MQQTVAGHAMDLLANEIRTSVPPITLRVTNVIGYIILIAVNIAASTGILGPTNAEISARHPTPLTPAGCVLLNTHFLVCHLVRIVPCSRITGHLAC